MRANAASRCRTIASLHNRSISANVPPCVSTVPTSASSTAKFARSCRRLFYSFAPGDVLFDGNVAGDHTAGVPQRGDRHLFGIEAAVLAAVGQFPAPDLTGGNRLPEISIERLILFAAFKEARVLSDDFLRCVAGQAP